jgi:hypothetical protein
MVKSMPDINSMQKNYDNTLRYIENYDGVSLVDLKSNYNYYPILPNRINKLLFSYGRLNKVWISNIELRESLKNEYEILKVYENIYYTKNCFPFKNYIEDLYKLRKEYKKENNSMELCVKLLMNSLYGKFGSKIVNRDNFISCASANKSDINNIKERIGEKYFRIVEEIIKPESYTIPIWATYVTAYARLELYKLLKDNNPIYCDTDSIITKNTIEESKEIGKLKLEGKIEDGIFVKPKFYYVNLNGYESVKIKGIPIKMNRENFINFLETKNITYNKIVKPKESWRRKLIYNQIIKINKEVNLEDNKRLWTNKFNYNEFEKSEPLYIE